MASQRDLVVAALDDIAALWPWRFVARRARLSKLYFQLRAEGVARRRAKTLVARTRKARHGVKANPSAKDVALDLILQ